MSFVFRNLLTPRALRLPRSVKISPPLNKVNVCSPITTRRHHNPWTAPNSTTTPPASPVSSDEQSSLMNLSRLNAQIESPTREILGNLKESTLERLQLHSQDTLNFSEMYAADLRNLESMAEIAWQIQIENSTCSGTSANFRRH